MNRPILALRVARRAIAAAIMGDEEFTLLDGRHISSRRQSMVTSVHRYLAGLLEQRQPAGVLILAPEERYDERGILPEVQAVLTRAGSPMRIVRVPELLKAFGVPPLQTREQLWDVIGTIAPDLANVQSSTKPYIVEAAGLALYAEAMLALLT